ncbi:ABC transporter substrate-binding protein [Actinokineospora auranticolor]|uniref:Peptide/nickel transport system substrate-binding protein n=1 Tax=Actinokineospora auranticolor TaxID=155976 RepID=A0A2S6GLX0_9PSEU|nr:ABC transporter substrate-binding protein [Actinokineospora auranticolor]PPK66180.1 peptide/nickel transport system substrate-binding protein [Actinokineospora auranticolor]
MRRWRERMAALAVAIALVGVSACGVRGAGAGGDRLVFATGQTPQCLDPQVSPQDIVATIDRNIFDSLVVFTRDGRFEPWLATRWDISADGLRYTFHLRPGVRFHDGTPLDAAAVAATLDHAVAPETKSQYAAGLIDAYDRSEVVGPTEIRIHLKRPSAPFLQALSTAYLGIQSPKSLRENKGALCGKPVGSGPFSFRRWSKNSAIELDRNPDYDWGPSTAAHTGPALVPGLTIRLISENASRFGALTSGQVDVIDQVPPANVPSLKRFDALRYSRAESPGIVSAVMFNPVRGVLADEQVRRAVLRAIDVDGLVRSVHFGQFDRAWSPLGPTTPGYARGLEGTWPHDPAAAGALLDAAGWTGRDARGYRTRDGVRLVLRWPYAATYQSSMVTTAQGVQAELKKVGIQLDYTGVDTGTFGELLETGDLDMFATSFIRADPDILNFFLESGKTRDNGGGNVFAQRHPELDRLLLAGHTELDPLARADLYAASQRYVVDHALILPLWVPAALVGYTDRVRGLASDPVGFPLFYDVDLRGRA